MKFKIKKIQTKLLLSYGLLLLVICAIFSILYFVSRNTIQNAAIESSRYTAEVKGEKLNTEIDYLMTVRDQIYNSSSVNKYVNAMISSSDSWSSHYAYSKLNTAMYDLTQILIQDSKNPEVMLYAPGEGLMYYSWTSLNNLTVSNEDTAEEIGKTIESLYPDSLSGDMSYERIHTSYNPNHPDDLYLYFYQAHKNPYSGENNYYIILGVPMESMRQYFSPLDQGEEIVIYTTSDQSILYSNFDQAPEFLEQTDNSLPDADHQIISYNGISYIKLCTPIASIGWTQIQLIPLQSVLEDLNYWSYLITLALGGLAVVLAVVCIYLNRNIFYPIKQLDSDIQLVKQGKTDLRPPQIKTCDEIGRLSVEFYDMVQQLHLLQKQMLLKEKQKRNLEIEALQAQINPHFMYNTIGSIKMLLRLNKPDLAASSLSALVDLLKHTISRSDETISLEEELHILKSYIYIQQRRYSDFQFEIHLPEELKEYHIMRFIIQPFIENSLLHGYEEIDSQTKISVSFEADWEKQRLIVWIRDNGCGIPPERMQEIMTQQQNHRGLNGIGVKNIIDRIRLNYGDPYSVEFDSTVKQGTAVRLTLPLLKGGTSVK